MEALADPFRCAIEIRGMIENGLGLRTALRRFIQQDQSDFTKSLGIWFIAFEQGQNRHIPQILRKNVHRLALLSVLSAGLQGESIFERLKELEEEMYQASIDEVEEKLRLLPLKTMMPLLLLQFPAFLLLLFGPILVQLKTSLG